MPGGADDSLGVLDRMTSILEAFDQDDRGLGVSELALRAGLPKSTVSRLVATLVRERYLERDGNRIHLGLRVFELGQLAQEPRPLRVVAPPVLAGLRDRSGQSVHLAIRDGGELVCIAVVRAGPASPRTVRTGARLPMHATASGKAVLAHLAEPERERILTGGLRAWTDRTIVDPDVLRRQLADVREGGIAVDAGEFAEDVCCAAAAVFAASGRLMGAVSVSGAANGFDPARFAPLLRAAASALARRLAAAAEVDAR